MVSIVGTSSSTGSSVTPPAHQAGDFIVIAGYSNSSGVSLGSGYSSIYQGNNLAIGYKVAASTNDASGFWLGASELVCAVYRPSSAHTIKPGGQSTVNSSTGSSNNTPSFNAVTFDVTDGSSWALGVIGHRSTDENLGANPPSGMSNRVDQVNTGELALHDTNGGVTGWSNTSVTLTGTANPFAVLVFEIKEVAVTVNNLTLNVTGAASASLKRQVGGIRAIASVAAINVIKAISAAHVIFDNGSVAVVKGASKNLSASSAGAVAQILRQWLKSASVTSSAIVAMGPRQAAKVAAVAASSIVQRIAAVATGRVLTAPGLATLALQSRKVLSITGLGLVTAARLTAKMRSMSSTSTASILAIKVKIVALAVSSAAVVSSSRQAGRLLSTASASIAVLQRLVSHGSSIGSSSAAAIGRSVSATRFATSEAAVSRAGLVARSLNVIGTSAAVLLGAIARTRTLALSSASVVTLRKGIGRALQISSGSIVSTFHAAVTRVILTISSSSAVAVSRRIAAVRAVTSQASLSARRQIARILGVVAGSSQTVQRGVFRSLTLTAGVRVTIGLIASIKETVNRYRRVVGRATRYLISGRSDVLIRGTAPTTIIGSTTMNTHEPLDFLCGTDWQLGGPQLNADGTPMGLNGATVQWKLDSIDGGTNYITLTDGNGITVDLTKSTVSIDVPGATTAGLSPGTYRDYLIVTLPAGQKIPMWTGIIRAAAQPA